MEPAISLRPEPWAAEQSSEAAHAAPHPPPIADRVWACAIFAVVGDGAVAAVLTYRAHAGVFLAVLGALVASSFLAVPAALVAAPLAWLFSKGEVRSLGRHLGEGLAGERSGHAGTALAILAGAVACSVVLVFRLGWFFSQHQSAHVAVLATVVLAVVSILVASVLIAATARQWTWLLDRVGGRLPGARYVAGVLLATIGMFALLTLLPVQNAVPPACALLGFAAGPWVKRWVFTLTHTHRVSTAALLLVSWGLSITAALTLKYVPDAVQLAVVYRAPYASLFCAGMRKVIDRDHDGYSPLLLGGDCNDSNAMIHPGAFDIPDNGIDENCSGSDAHVYNPSPPPAASYAEPLPPRSNIILIQLDATRPDHIGFTGYRRPTTPHLDRFRQGATWFRSAYTPAPTTRFAMASLFTGLEVDQIPQRRGGMNFFLLQTATTFAERLEPIGYDRVGYTISYVMQHHVDTGQGFRIWQTPWPVNDWEKSYGTAAPQTTDAAIDYLKGMPADGTKPFLLFLHYQETHDPYVDHLASHYGTSDIDHYDSALSFCDESLGRLFDAIDARADKDRTAVIVFSDHGELFGEHGFSNHGYTLYQPDVRILLLARLPHGKVSTVDDPVSLTDVTPTVLELAGAAADPASHAWSLVPYAVETRAKPRPRRPMFLYADLVKGTVHYELRGVLEGRYKYIHDLGTGVNQLYDVERDPEELSNLVDTAPTMRGHLAEMLDSWEAYVKANSSGTPPVSEPGASLRPFNTSRH